MTLRYRAFVGDIKRHIDEFVSSMDYDREIAPHVIRVLRAHVEHLVENNNIPKTAGHELINVLKNLEDNPGELLEYASKGNFEDIHEALESYLHEKKGDLAGYAPLGRSRNDHVAAAIRLKTVDETVKLVRYLMDLRINLVKKAKERKDNLFVTHTHFQPAQATTFVHYLLSIEEELSDLTDALLWDAGSLILKSPLGAAAGAGTCVKMKREELARKLGFKEVIKAPLYATGSRIFLQRFVSNLLQVSSVLERFLNDLYLYSNPAINIIELPSRHLQTSSLMPHKRNPATVEVMRARLSELRGFLLSINLIETRLPTGYSLDLQEATPIAWRASRILRDVLKMLVDLVKDMDVNNHNLLKYITENINGVTEVVEYISLKTGYPFRKVHMEMSRELSKTGWDISKALINIAKKFNLDENELRHLLDPRNQVNCKITAGSFEDAETLLFESETKIQKQLKSLEELAKTSCITC